jgi:hypothetical protein
MTRLMSAVHELLTKLKRLFILACIPHLRLVRTYTSLSIFKGTVNLCPSLKILQDPQTPVFFSSH